MSFFGLLLVAIGVSADAFAVALGKGLHMKTFDLRHAIAIAVTFGGFQAVMPLLGWLLARQFAPYITGVDHWVAFGLLCLIGAKMIIDAVRGGDDDEEDSDALPVGSCCCWRSRRASTPWPWGSRSRSCRSRSARRSC